MKRLLPLSITITVVSIISFASPAPAHADGVMLQGWYWESPVGQPEQWWDKLSRQMAQLRAWGVTGLWIPPACKGGSGGYSSGYDLYDYYDLGSKDQKGTYPTKWGTKENLLKMISIAHANGIDVYFDLVPNHRSGGAERGFRYDSLAGSEAVGRFTMAPWDFHQNGHGDWDEAVAGLPDVAQEVPYVRDGMFRWIRWLDRQTGVDGYRIDAAKHMPPGFTEGLLWQVQEGSGQSRFAVGEFYDGNPGTLQWWIDAVQRRSGTFDFTLFFQLLSMAHGGGYYDMRGLRHRLWDESKSVTFANSHDTFRRANGLHLFMRADMAYAFILSATGYPCIYWEDMFDAAGDARGYMTNMMWVRNKLARGAQLERWADHDLYVFERQGNLLAGFNDAGGHWRSEWVRTEFGPNVRLRDYGRHGVGDVWTNEHGWAYVSVPPSGYVMYGRAGQEGPLPRPPMRRTVQELEAAADMDTRPAGEWWGEPQRFTARAGEPIYVDLYLEDPNVVAHVALFDATGKRLNHARGQGHVFFDFGSPPADGWYQVRVGLERTKGGGTRSDYWLKVSYMGPDAPPGPAPSNGYWDLLPLVASSVGP